MHFVYNAAKWNDAAEKSSETVDLPTYIEDGKQFFQHILHYTHIKSHFAFLFALKICT